MATNLLEIVSLLEKINLATINNPKVLQNAVKAIEVISNSSNSSIRQKALIFQEKLKENPNFIELNKKEETKQAEIQQERSEKLQEQLQAKRAISASDKIEKEKKEEKQEKIKEQEFKTLLNSGSFSSLPLWQQLEVLDYGFNNYNNLTNQEKINLCQITIDDYRNGTVTAEKKSRYEKHANTVVERVEENNGKTFTIQTLNHSNKKVAEQEHLAVTEIDNNNPELSNSERNKRSELVYSEVTKAEFANNLYFKSNADRFKLSFTKKGKPEILELVNGEWIHSNHTAAISFLEQNKKKLEAAQHLVKNESSLTVLSEERAVKIQKINEIPFHNSQDIFATISDYYNQVDNDSEKLKQQGIFNSNASDHSINLVVKDFYFSDVIKSNPDTTMAFHITMKNFIKNMDKDSSERSADAYDIFAQCPFVQELLSKGENGEVMLRSMLENQWWSKAECDQFIPKMKQILQEPDFQQKVEQAKQNNVSIEEFRKQYPEHKLQDSLIAYFKTDPKFKEKFEELAKTYSENGEINLRNKLLEMDNKELKQFIERETGLTIEPEKLKPYLRDRGLTDTDEIKKVLSNNELGEEAKQENVALTSESKKNEKAGFLTGFETKEQIEQTISDNSKRLGYETANPSKPENQEQNNNSMQYNQSTSITSNT